MPNALLRTFCWLLLASWRPLGAQTLPPPAAADGPASLPVQCLGARAPRSYAPLRQALAGARVVMLGEQTHYDGATFEAKIDLIRYLHDSLGYNTLAFEGDMYALDKARRELAAGKAPLPVLQDAVYEGIWSGTTEFRALATYLAAHPKLQVAGFDCQLSGEYTHELLLPELRAFVRQDKRTRWTEADFYPAQELLAELSGGDFGQQLRHPADTLAFARWLGRTRASLAYVAARVPGQAGRAGFWQQWLRSAAHYRQGTLAAGRGRRLPAQNQRDALMADNLLYLARQPEHARIIVWAASYHVANRVAAIDLDDAGTARYLRQLAKQQPSEEEDSVSARQLLAGAVPMGQLVKNKLGAAAYALGFVAYDGAYGRADQSIGVHPLLAPLPESIEAEFARRGCEAGFVNLRGSRTGSYYAAPLGYLPLRAPWAQVFDGLFFTRTMHPTHGLATSTVPVVAAGGRLLGTVRDAKTNAPVAFATVGLRGQAGGTVSNEDGGFALLLPAGPGPADSVLITCLGYAPVRLPLAGRAAGVPVQVALVPQAHLLGEVVVRVPPSAETILRNARERMVANYPQQPHSMQLYTRTSYRRDSLRVQLEGALDFYDQEGYRRGSWEHASRTRYLQVRQLRKTGDSTQAEYRETPLYWLLWSADPVLTTRNPLEAGPMRKYRLTLRGQTQYNNRLVYEVGFVCEHPSAYTTPYGYPAPATYEGTVHVDADNFAVVRYEAFTTRTPHEITKPKPLRVLGFAHPAIARARHHDLYQYEQQQGTYYLHYARRETWTDYLEAGATQPRRWQDVSELLTTSLTLTHPQVLQTSLLEVNARVPYRPEFWNGYQVVLPAEQ